MEVGQILRRGGTVFRIAEEGPPTEGKGRWLVLQDPSALERRGAWEFDLLLLIAKGEVVRATPDAETRALQGELFEEDDVWLSKLSTITMTDAQRRDLLATRKYIQELRKRGYANLCPEPLLQLEYERVARDVFKEEPPYALSTIYDWSLKFDRADGDPVALIRGFTSRGGKGVSRLTKRALDALAIAFKEIREDGKARATAKGVQIRVSDILTSKFDATVALAETPSQSTAERQLKATFGGRFIAERNHGKAYAEKKYRVWTPRESGGFAGECYEFDDKDTRIYLLDDGEFGTGLPYGRAYITAGIDQHTKAIPGWELSHEHRSKWSAISAFVHALFPKDPNDPMFELCHGRLEAFGRPALALFDNAMYNHAKSVLATMSNDVGVIPAHARAYTGPDKAEIEGFNNRIEEDFLPTVPGHVGRKNEKDRRRDPVASAIMGVGAFRARFAHWVIDSYMNTPGVDGLTPRQRWRISMQGRHARIPTDVTRIRLLAFERHHLRLRPEGLNFLGLIYASDQLRSLASALRYNVSVNFRYHPRDLMFVYVEDPRTGELFLVPSAMPEYTKRLTLFQQRLIRKLAKSDRINNPSVAQLFIYREKLREITEQLRKSTKLKQRRSAMNTGPIPGAKGPQTTPSEPVQAVTELEHAMEDLDAVEMDMSEEGW